MTSKKQNYDAVIRPTSFNRLTDQNPQLPRNVLWNVIEPGDPYDIRKSMIAKLPSQSKKFMGDNIELVCLFQAAEIERLNEYLLEYRERYIELERRQLDRHSYEIQIKELTQRLAGQGNLRNESYKLQEHIRRLNAQIEDLHQKLRASSGSAIDSQNYQNALRKIQGLIQQNNNLTYQNTSLQNSISQLRSELESINRSRSQERDEFSYRLNEANRVAASMNQTQSIISKLESDLQRAQRQIQRLTDSVQAKNHEINDLIDRMARFQEQLHSQKGNYDKMIDFQNKIALMAQQIERLNEILKDKHKKYDDLAAEKDRWDMSLMKVSGEKSLSDSKLNQAYKEIDKLEHLLKGYLNELNATSSNKNIMEDMQKQLINAGQQIDRLNKIIKMTAGERDSVRRDYDQLIYQANRLPLLEKENEDYKKHINALLANKKNLNQYEDKIALLTVQINRLQQKNQKQDQYQLQNQRLRQQNARLKVDINKIEDSLKGTHYAQIQNLRRQYEDRIKDIEMNTFNRYMSELSETKDKYETMISHLSRDLDPDAQRKIQLLSNEVDRLNEVLERTRTQNSQLLVRNGELERVYPQLQEKDHIIRNLQVRVQDLDARIRGLLGEKVDVQTKIRSISQQNETVKKNHDFTIRDLEALKQENQNLRRDLNQLNDWKFRSVNLETQLREVVAENNRLKNMQRYYSQRISELESDLDLDADKKVQYLVQELDRLATILQRMKQQISDLNRQNIELKNSLRDSQNKNTTITALQNKINHLQNQLRAIEGQNIQVQTRVRSISEQNEKFKRGQDSITREIEFLRKENSDLRGKVSQLLQYEKKVKDYEGELNYLRNQAIKSHNYIAQINTIKSENNRLAYELRNTKDKADLVASLSQTIKHLQSKIRMLEEENKKLTIQVSTTNNQQLFINDLATKVRDLQRQIYELKIQNDRLKNQLSNSKDKDNLIAHLSERVKDLEKNLRDLQGESSGQMLRVRSLSQQNDTLKRNHDYASRDIDILRKENEELKRKITELMVQLEKNKKMANHLQYLEEQLKFYKEQGMQIVTENDQLSQKIRELLALEDEYIRMKEANQKLMNEVNELYQRITVIISDKDKANQKISSLQKDLARSQFSIGEKQNIVKQKEQKIDGLSKNIQDLTKDLVNFYSMKAQNQKLNFLVKEKGGELDREKAHWGKKVDDLQKDKKNLDKKKKINDINNEYALMHMEFMEEEAQRLKREKDSLFNKDVNELKELRQEIQKLVADNAALKKYLADLNIQIEQKIKFYEEKILTITREKDQVQKELKRTKDENAKKVDKNKLKQLIKSINQQALNRNSYYQDEIKRARGQKQSDKKNLQSQIQDYKYKIKMLDKQDDLKRTKIGSLEQIIEHLRSENMKNSDKIRELEGVTLKITVYETKIADLTKTIQYLTERNNTLQNQERDKGQKYKDLVTQLRDYENTLQNLINQYRSLQLMLAQYRQENTGLHETAKNYDKLKGDLSKAQIQKNNLNSNLDLLNQTLAKIRSEKEQIIKNNLDQQKRISDKFKDEYSRQISQYERVISDLSQKNLGLKDQVSEYDRAKLELSELSKKIEKLIKELQRANDDLRDSVDKQHKLENSNLELKKTIEEYLRRITELEKQKNELEALIDRRGQQAETCIQKFTEQNKQLRIKLEKARESAHKIPEYEAKIQELNRLVDELTEKIRQDIKAQASYGNKINSAEQERNELQKTVDSLKQKLFMAENSYKTSLQNLSFENSDLKKKSNQIPSLNIKTQSLQAKTYQLGSDLQRLQRALADKDKEIQRVRNSYELKLQGSSAETTRLVQNFGKLQSEYNSLLRQYDLLRRRASESDIGIGKINGQFQRLQGILERMKIERTSIIDKNIKLGREYDRLGSTNKGLQADIKQLQLEVSDKISLQKRVQQQLALMVVLFAEIESLRGRIANSDKQNAELRRRSLSPLRL